MNRKLGRAQDDGNKMSGGVLEVNGEGKERTQEISVSVTFIQPYSLTFTITCTLLPILSPWSPLPLCVFHTSEDAQTLRSCHSLYQEHPEPLDPDSNEMTMQTTFATASRSVQLPTQSPSFPMPNAKQLNEVKAAAELTYFRICGEYLQDRHMATDEAYALLYHSRYNILGTGDEHEGMRNMIAELVARESHPDRLNSLLSDLARFCPTHLAARWANEKEMLKFAGVLRDFTTTKGPETWRGDEEETYDDLQYPQ